MKTEIQLPSFPKKAVLLADAHDWKRASQRACSDVFLGAVKKNILERAERLIQMDLLPLEPDSGGRRRMLTPARRVLGNVLLLGSARMITADVRFSQRAAAEVDVAVARKDWNPDHFLDTAELALGVAIACSWLGCDVSPARLENWREALVKKALEPSFKDNLWWHEANNNWAQVCHGGLVAAALVVADEMPDLAQRTLIRAISSQPKVLQTLAPDGVYIEGPTYWGYGMTYSAILISLLERNFGSTFGLEAMPGFLTSANFVTHSIGPCGYSFSFGDTGLQPTFTPALCWYASRLGKPEMGMARQSSLLDFLAKPMVQESRLEEGNRFWPLSLLWCPSAEEGKTASAAPLYWFGRGEVPIGYARTSWNDINAAYLAIKGGSPSVNHADMDVGSFIYERGGVRWAVDLGMERYEQVEGHGIDLFDQSQASARWTVFRKGAESHNILRFDGAGQWVLGSCDKAYHWHKQMGDCFEFDLTPAYANAATFVRRRAQLNADGSLLIEDEWESVSRLIRWQWLTFAEVEMEEGGGLLRQADKRLRLRFEADLPLAIRVECMDDLLKPYDTPNPGLKRIVVDIDNRPGQRGFLRCIANLL